MKTISYHNYEASIKNVDLDKLPPLLIEGHRFFIEARPHCESEQVIKEAIDLYLKRLNEHLAKQKSNFTNSPDLAFVKRFVAMNNTSQSKFTIGQYLLGLQDAISHKQITKTSPAASHITEIQQKLIKHYNRLSEGERITIMINEEWHNSLKVIVNLQFSRLGTISSESGAIAPINKRTPLPKASGLFEAMDSISEQVNPNTFRLEGAFGEFLGDLERFELAITIEGDQGSGKTRFTYQLANAFALPGHRIAIFSLEIGRNSDLIRRMKSDYLLPENQSQVFIADTLPDGMDSIRKAATAFDVVIIDSWNKVGVSSLDFDSLRKQFPNTIFIVIFQRTTQKTIRGGTAPLYDAGINIEVVKADDSFKNNYAVTTKNRYGVTGIQFGIHTQEVLNGSSEEKPIETDFEILNP